jgi:signal transduction histidine kinase/CheY-like chemotaxis protein/HPt (histidine-containing phosphotransfer) domain-containing protein
VKEDSLISVQLEIKQLHKQCAYLERKLGRLREQQRRQENIDDINRHILKVTNERLQQFHHQAQQENISKSDFLANMSHEIRTPLNIILGMANLLADTNLDKTQTQYLNSLRVTGRQLTEILNNVLEFSRIDAGKISFEPEPFSLEKIIHQLEASIMPLCIQKQIQYSVEYSSLLIMERIGDQLKIYQILLNLFNNAVKFTATGGAITLEVKEDSQIPGNLILSVVDTGIGISEEHQKIIFDRFTQVHDLFARPNSGTGLGLAICQKLTSAMGGELKVQSKPGVGSVFSCTLPLAPVSPSERNIVRLEAHHIHPASFPKLKILAVDDVKENLEVIKVYLRDYPVNIEIAGDGEEALRLLAKNQFHLILMDIRMPVMDGITATGKIRQMEHQGGLRPHIILAITAHAFQEQKKKIIEAGFDGVLSKPFFRRDLIQTIYRFASMSRVPLQPERLGNKAIGFCLEHEKAEDIPESLKELIPTLIQTITDDLHSMKLFMEKHEYENLYAKAHSLKGVAGMFGFQELGSLIFDLSQTIKAGNLIVAHELFGTLDCYLDRLR